jgi:ATP-dependent RNA helicase SUPV3L1/SUV3
MLLRGPSRVRVPKGKPFLAKPQLVPKVEEKFIKETLAETRDHDWISNTRMSKTQRQVLTSGFKSLGDLEGEQDIIFLKDVEFRSLLERLLFHAVQSAKTEKPRHENPTGSIVFGSFTSAKVFCPKSFDDKLTQSLKEFKEVKDVQLIHLIVPTAQTLPNTIYTLLHQASASPASSKLIEDFFSTRDVIDTAETRAYYLMEQAYNAELKLVQSHRIPVQELKVDITNPAEWYPKARSIKRKLILHVGPTNSGKTYNALKRLKESNHGYFAGPLRLLAREVYDRFKSENIPCNLITGEEIVNDIDEFGNSAPLSCGTVEMIDLNTHFEVAVLDEIQMIGDPYRGWAWTNALLGVRANEVHLCGEASAVRLVKKIAAMTGDEVFINEYERLGELRPEEESLQKGIQDLRKGDCVVMFSKKKILNMKADIEAETNLKCAVVYGALPAETRSAEANKFNAGKCDILVASDAIGMGLNLKIDRVLFSTHKKFDGHQNTKIEPPQVKQIAGRAGRFKIAPTKGLPIPEGGETDSSPSVGYVSAFDDKTLRYVKQCLDQPTQMLDKAYLWPSDEIWSNYMSEFPKDVSFSTIIRAFELEVQSSKIFKVSSAEERLKLVDVFEKFKELLIGDRLRMSTAPLNLKMEGSYEVLKEFSQAVANSQTKLPIHFASLEFERILSRDITGVQAVDSGLLGELETLHKFLLVWLWMNNRYPTLFVDRESATDLKNLIEEKIETILESKEEELSVKRKGKAPVGSEAR